MEQQQRGTRRASFHAPAKRYEHEHAEGNDRLLYLVELATDVEVSRDWVSRFSSLGSNRYMNVDTAIIAALPSRSAFGRFCCKSLFALAIKISFGCTGDFHVNMWGTSLSEEKLAGDPGNVIEATSIGGRRSDFLRQEN